MKENLIGKKILGVLHGQTVFRYIEGFDDKYTNLAALKKQNSIKKIKKLSEKGWAIGQVGKSKVFRKSKQYEWYIYEIVE